jgi:hypothetical protein
MTKRLLLFLLAIGLFGSALAAGKEACGPPRTGSKRAAFAFAK